MVRVEPKDGKEPISHRSETPNLPPKRVLGADATRSAWTHSELFETVTGRETKTSVVYVSQRVAERNRGVFHRVAEKRKDGEDDEEATFVCQQGGSARSLSLWEEETNPKLRPCDFCFRYSGASLTEVGWYREPDPPTLVCPGGCEEEIVASQCASHMLECSERRV